VTAHASERLWSVFMQSGGVGMFVAAEIVCGVSKRNEINPSG